MDRAVCMRCGNATPYAPASCPNCGFVPQSATDLAKSFILSTQFDVGEATFGRPPAELSQISAHLARGTPYQFDDAEVAAVQSELAAFRALRPRMVLVDLLKWVGFPVVILAALFVWLRFK